MSDAIAVEHRVFQLLDVSLSIHHASQKSMAERAGSDIWTVYLISKSVLLRFRNLNPVYRVRLHLRSLLWKQSLRQ